MAKQEPSEGYEGYGCYPRNGQRRGVSICEYMRVTTTEEFSYIRIVGSR